MYASVLAYLGLGLAMTETQHHALLTAAIVVALGLSARRAAQTQRWRFVAVTALGCALLVTSHVAGEIAILSAAGILVLLIGGWMDRRRGRIA